MDFAELVRKRYSVRAYQSRDIPKESLRRILEAFILAPTAANRQALGVIVIHTKGKEKELERIYHADWFAKQPPLVLCVCAIPEQCWSRRDGKNYADVDAAIAMDHLILAATEEGLGTCWIGAFDPGAAREVLSLPANVEPIAFTPLGYPADSPKPKLRKSFEQLVHYERW
ncbi:MAG: nitroreductase family protein [Anaerolineae bacterium]|nr:nitroreductase family protein [Anaerolineae bacterium]